MGEPVSGGGGWEDCSPGGEGGANVFVSAVVSKRKLLAKIFVSISSSCFQGETICQYICFNVIRLFPFDTTCEDICLNIIQLLTKLIFKILSKFHSVVPKEKLCGKVFNGYSYIDDLEFNVLY